MGAGMVKPNRPFTFIRLHDVIEMSEETCQLSRFSRGVLVQPQNTRQAGISRVI